MGHSSEEIGLLQYNRAGAIGGKETHGSNLHFEALLTKLLRDLAESVFILELEGPGQVG